MSFEQASWLELRIALTNQGWMPWPKEKHLRPAIGPNAPRHYFGQEAVYPHPPEDYKFPVRKEQATPPSYAGYGQEFEYWVREKDYDLWVEEQKVAPEKETDAEGGIVCSNCNSSNIAGVKSCSRCGNQLTAKVPK